MTKGSTQRDTKAMQHARPHRRRTIGAASGALLAALALGPPPLVPDADAVVVCQRTNRRGVVRRLTLQPGPECTGPRETLVLDLEAPAAGGPGAAPGVVGIGSIIAHSTHLPGSSSVPEMQGKGFAVCDGTTPVQQGIADAVLTGNTPNLNGERRFLRGTNLQTGALESDATAINDLVIVDGGHAHPSGVGSFCGQGTGPTRARAFFDDICAGSVSATESAEANVTLGGGADESRPVNMSVLWMIRVR